MSKKNIVQVPLIACSLVLVMGALNHQPHFLAPAARKAFLAHPVSLDAGVGKLTPAHLLARAASLLGPDKVFWLRVKTWQKQVDEEVSFEAEGCLVRGPNRCARLELVVCAGKEPTEVVIVSDGVGLAHACRLPGQALEVSAQKFTKAGNSPMTVEEIERVLNAKGCGGPYCLLKEMERVLVNLTINIGTWKDRPIIKLTGSLQENPRVAPEVRFGAPLRACHLYLDAQTLWPHRLEWWASQGPEDPAFLLLELEFRDPEINRPLSHDDCVRAFSYQPGQ